MRRVVSKVIMSYVMGLFLTFVLSLGLSGCDLSRENRPSVLVIAVEGLGFENLSCDTESVGLQPLCEESVRFSHAFAPSTMSQATMASLLTGLYPVDHGVHNNGADFLSAKFETLAEGALSKKYHTLFVSGGVPIWRKSGLAQGFEVFDDQVDISPGLYYRPAAEVVRTATHFLDHEVGGQPFLNVLFFADLQFPQVVTRTDEGEVRELSSSAQVDEVVESMGTLFRWLKAHKRWNNTNIVVVGLNSQPSTNEMDREPTPLSLRSSSVQVSLFIKPARSERDNVIQWAVDRNVSLVDVGVTMFEWLGLKPPKTSLSELKPQSLVSVLHNPEPNWEEDRLILSETGWPDWLEGDGVRWALRQNQFLFINDKHPLIFNTLADRNETLSLRSSDPLWTSLNSEVLALLAKSRNVPFRGMQAHWPEQLRVARELFRDGQMNRQPKGDEAWAKWYLRRAVIVGDWQLVKRLSKALGEPIGTYIAAKHLKEFMPMPRSPCLRLILATKGDRKKYQSECEDEKVLALHAWQAARNDDERQSAQDRFMRMYLQFWMDQEIGRLNYLSSLRWDVDRELPEGPQLVDYILSLKEFESFAKKAASNLNAKDARL